MKQSAAPSGGSRAADLAPSPPCKPPVKEFISQVSGCCLPMPDNLVPPLRDSIQRGRGSSDSQEVVIPFHVWASGKTRPRKTKQFSSRDLALEVFLSKYFLPLQCEFQGKPLPESPGRHFALPVAYLSKVTHHLSRCLKKTPASAFTPHFTRSYFISTSTEVTFPFSSPLQIPQGENGILSLYSRELQPGHTFVNIFKKKKKKKVSAELP